MIYGKKDNFDAIAQKYNISPVIARIIRNRDVVGDQQIEEYLHGDIDDMHSPHLMKGIDDAVAILAEKIQTGKRIRVMSDYDIDGICSGYILIQALGELGAQVDLKIPDRVKDGYGLNPEMVTNAWEEGINTIVTCDNGIAAMEAVDRAKRLGMTVIVTDHHEVPFKEEWSKIEYLYPPADVIIDPKQEEEKYPFRELCGAGVAYKLIQALFEHFGLPDNEATKYLEYAAIATVGDVVPLLEENRIIVKYGLNLLNRTTNVGLAKLIAANHLQDKVITSYHIGFVLGPCLNAAGRLETAQKAFELLCEEDEGKAEWMANELTDLNQKRKQMTLEGIENAKQDLETFAQWPVMVLYLPDCHESVAGIIAGRIRDMIYRPTIILTNGQDGVKGSGRSIPGYNMFEELTKCKRVLTKFGGHAMAAGLSLEEENIDVLRNMLNRNIQADVSIFTRKLWIDVALPFEYVSLDLTQQIDMLEPFGKDNEKPAFGEKNVSILRMKLFGQDQNVVKMEMANSQGCRITGVCFDHNREFITYIKEQYGEDELNRALTARPNNIRLSIIYCPSVNEYRGHKKVEIIIKNYK